jgi:2-octaprenyl-6-methoxyphenol hydroxylase
VSVSPRVIVVGAGPVGAVAGLALAAAGVPVMLLDARPRGAWRHDRRSLALSWGSRLVLERCGVWPGVARADPIDRVVVSERGMFGTMELSARELGVPALGHVVDYADLARSCAQALDAASVEVVHEARVEALAPLGDGARVSGPAGAWQAAWVLLADGAEGVDGGGVLQRTAHPYRQVALVGDVDCADLAPGTACERFAGRGPLALLPRAGRHACVWVMPQADASAMLLGSIDQQSRALTQAAGAVAGSCRWREPPAAVPLSLARTRTAPGSRVVPIGNASQALHPVAGQGLNLGLRDAWAIARDWPATADATSEQRHVARRLDGRRLDRSLTIGATDALARLTAVDWLPMRVARGLGIAALDAVPAVRRQVLSTLVFGA